MFDGDSFVRYRLLDRIYIVEIEKSPITYVCYCSVTQGPIIVSVTTTTPVYILTTTLLQAVLTTIGQYIIRL